MAVLAAVLPAPILRLSMIVTCMPRFVSLCAIKAPEIPPPMTTTSLRIFFLSLLCLAIRGLLILQTGLPVRRSRLIGLRSGLPVFFPFLLHSPRHVFGGGAKPGRFVLTQILQNISYVSLASQMNVSRFRAHRT